MPQVLAEVGVIQVGGQLARRDLPGPADRGEVMVVGLEASTSLASRLGVVIVVGLEAQAERWYATYEDATGELLSVGTVLGDLPPGYLRLEIFGPPGDDEVWDKVARTFIPRDEAEVVDLVDEIMGDVTFPDVSVQARVAIRDILEVRIEDECRYS